MPNTSEKRILVHQWIEKASEEVVEVFYESLIEENNPDFSKDLLEELDRRRALHLSGTNPSFTLEELNGKINVLRVTKFGL